MFIRHVGIYTQQNELRIKLGTDKIESLSNLERITCLLFALECWRTSEIAKYLGISKNEVRQHLYSSIATLPF